MLVDIMDEVHPIKVAQMIAVDEVEEQILE
jgi:hypothetical protein